MSTISLRLPQSLHNQVRKLAQEEQISINHAESLSGDAGLAVGVEASADLKTKIG